MILIFSNFKLLYLLNVKIFDSQKKIKKSRNFIKMCVTSVLSKQKSRLFQVGFSLCAGGETRTLTP